MNRMLKLSLIGIISLLCLTSCGSNNQVDNTDDNVNANPIVDSGTDLQEEMRGYIQDHKLRKEDLPEEFAEFHVSQDFTGVDYGVGGGTIYLNKNDAPALRVRYITFPNVEAIQDNESKIKDFVSADENQDFGKTTLYYTDKPKITVYYEKFKMDYWVMHDFQHEYDIEILKTLAGIVQGKM